MKAIITTIIIFAVTLFSASFTLADGNGPKQKSPTMKKQTTCPVMDGEIDSTIYTDIQGQRVYFCCPMCIKKFKANPDEYFKQATKDGVVFENIQKTCPITGEELSDKTIFTDYEGCRVYFCCQKCVNTFKKDPLKYLQSMDQSSSKQKKQTTNSFHQQNERPRIDKEKKL